MCSLQPHPSEVDQEDSQFGSLLGTLAGKVGEAMGGTVSLQLLFSGVSVSTKDEGTAPPYPAPSCPDSGLLLH